MFKSVRFSAALHYFKPFSTVTTSTNRAIVYARNGDPADVLRVVDYPTLPPPEPHTVNVRFLLSPINPADVNVVEGIYPVKAESVTNLSSTQEKPIFVGGNEGLAEVVKTGDGVAGLHEGDWVVMTRQQAGTWCSERNVQMEDVLKIPKKQGLTEAEAATITVNPPTAYNMLHEFVSLRPGDWLVQNGANSAVGQAVIQIAASEGIKTLNFVRNRDDFGALREHLLELGASDVMTYDDLSDKSKVECIRAMTSGNIRLGLNCVGGRETAVMARLLGEDSHLVSYGAMSKQPLSLSSSLFIFRNITAHGFWQSRWYRDRPRDEKETMMHKMAQLISEKKLAAPAHEIVTISTCESCEQATNKVKSIFTQLSGGRYGKKILLKFRS
ncbi:trans-2-enoyl-CoA reductase [Amanita muscaria]